MSLFKRRSRRSATDAGVDADAEAPDVDALGADEGEPEGPRGGSGRGPAGREDQLGQGGGSLDDAVQTFDRSGGPFDVDEVDGPDGRLDAGALWLPLAEGMELQLQVDEAGGAITGAFIVSHESGVQVQAFAAPRTEGIWPDICAEIAAGITEQGGTADPGYGRFGRELLARVPAHQADGTTVYQPLRFTGVDGPRWFLRAVFHGQAAVDQVAAANLEDLVGRIVVVRGQEPMGPRELLTLRLPEGARPGPVSDEPAPGEPVGGAEPRDPHERLARDEQPPRTYDDLRPFQRGPEITERR
ncbi:MAG: DUF3710 domain-containing protein [Angustibacter sp.]